MTPSDPELSNLQVEAEAQCQSPDLRAMLARHWPGLGQDGRAAVLSTRIHPADQMLLHSLRHHRDVGASVSQYFNVALQQYHAARQILDLTLPPGQGEPVAVLDFACGFGRLLRFLSCCDRELHITASEIQLDALQFVGDEFGVATLPSCMKPEDFDPGRRFDFIWVASLFSHLPEGLFGRWLARLSSLLTPRGVLCFSVHDEVLAPPGDAVGPSGLLFKGHSENADLDAEAYGTTYVTEAFVRRAIGQLPGPARRSWRIRKGLAHEQDIYVLAADPARSLDSLGGFRRGAWGWADERRVDAGRLILRGWAASIDDGALPCVMVRIDGEEHRVPSGLPRPDVRDAFADARLLNSGWSFEIDLPPQCRPWVEVTARSANGETALLYGGWPAGRPSRGHVYRRAIDMAVRSSMSVLASMVAPGSRVLDLGIGGGALGRALTAHRRCEVHGVTHNPDERAAGADAYARIELLDLEGPGWSRRFAGLQFDVIVCGDVLEHLRQPELVLRECAALVRPGGYLLASVPNAAYAGMVVELMHGNWNYGPEGLLDRSHLRFFTRTSFERLLRAEGWATERVEPIDLSWYYTEFWRPFDLLPPAVARYVLAQPDASAYQFVFAARRSGQAGQAATAVPRDAPAGDPAIHVAVFATVLVAHGRDGREIKLHRLGRVGAGRQRLRFDLPPDIDPDRGLRWYMADRPGWLHLHRVRLVDRRQQVRWEIADGSLAPAVRSWSRAQVEVIPRTAEAQCGLLLTGESPWLDLPSAEVLRDGAAPFAVEVECDWPLSADYRAAIGRAPPVDHAVEVIVPVYEALPHVQRCLSSVMETRADTPWHVTVIDDCSPDPEVGNWLTRFAAVHPGVTVVTNARNLGFVGTVNLGMRLAGRRDVILLNSDTEVSGDWLDRLHRCAWRHEDVGTVTPFSNNATICSFPRFCEANELPPGHDTVSLDALFAAHLAGASVEVPTAVGFCMYIRRDCLDTVGEFDAETFGSGYGEENDFCMRAAARGWRHLHALDVFVHHAGGVSFSTRQQELQARALAAIRRLHPGYEDQVRSFVQNDPARPFRESIERMLNGSSA